MMQRIMQILPWKYGYLGLCYPIFVVTREREFLVQEASHPDALKHIPEPVYMRDGAEPKNLLKLPIEPTEDQLSIAKASSNIVFHAHPLA